ncbi:MAG: hypothetical protein ACLQBD_01975 [Syntrophobacteraceae bacterium]
MFDFLNKGESRTNPAVKFDREKLVLRVARDKESWVLDLRLCNNAEQLCFWLLVLNQKPWVTNDLLGQFVWALTDACRVVLGKDPALVFSPRHPCSPVALWIGPHAKSGAVEGEPR